MAASFSGLHIGTSAIHAAQRGLDVTGQNIANSATPGYTRQRVDLESIGGPGVPAFWSKYDGSGEGVKVTGVTRMTDQFLVARANHENAGLGSLQEQQKALAAIERTFAEPSDLGLQKTMDKFFSSWSQTAIGPNSDGGKAARNAAFENAVNTAMQLNHMSNQMQTQWSDTVSEMDAHITEVNSLAERVADLNKAIRNNNIAKVPSNELLDQRDQLIVRISELTGATTSPAGIDKDAPFNSQAVDVWIGDTKLVDGVESKRLALADPHDGKYPADNDDPALAQGVTVTWEEDGADAEIPSGRLAGQLKSVNETIPKYLTQLDKVASELAASVNEVQADGFAVSGDSGQALFTDADGGTDRITAGNITVRRDSLGPNDLAISEGQPPDALDGNNAIKMAALQFKKDGARADYATAGIGLGVEAGAANGNVTKQSAVVRQADDARDNVSGVSLNEEMTNMIQFQHSFAAAAKFISTIDQVLDTLINMKR